jgi:cystathionine beta-synthase
VVTLVCDTGAKYLTKMFNDMWLAAHGFDQRELHGDLRDLIAKRYADGGVVAIGPDDTLLTAYNRMRSGDISQLPVVDHGKLVGILDESDILAAVEGVEDDARGPKFKTLVGAAMTKAINTLESTQGVDALPDVFDRDEVALVCDGDEFVGVITRVDLINHLRLVS